LRRLRTRCERARAGKDETSGRKREGEEEEEEEKESEHFAEREREHFAEKEREHFTEREYYPRSIVSVSWGRGVPNVVKRFCTTKRSRLESLRNSWGEGERVRARA